MNIWQNRIADEKQNTLFDGNLALEKADIPMETVNDVEINTNKHINASYLVLKRCFDFMSSLIVSVVLLIPLGILALLVVVKDFGNPFYVQKRVGQNGRELRMVKLRSMKRGADSLETMLTPVQLAEYHREYKLCDDPRLIGYEKPGDSTKCFGGFIRKTSLDELPQIAWNICIKGDMSVLYHFQARRDPCHTLSINQTATQTGAMCQRTCL